MTRMMVAITTSGFQDRRMPCSLHKGCAGEA
jgi:hypothetical protein